MRSGGKLRAFLARIMRWSDKHAVELAANSVTLASAGCVAPVLCGEGDLVPIALALPRRVRRPGRPFIVPDPRRGDHPASVRSPASRGNALAALEAARGGTFCFRLGRTPADLYTSRNPSHAAERLGMAPVSLSRRLGRRELPR